MPEGNTESFRIDRYGMEIFEIIVNKFSTLIVLNKLGGHYCDPSQRFTHQHVLFEFMQSRTRRGIKIHQSNIVGRVFAQRHHIRHTLSFIDLPHCIDKSSYFRKLSSYIQESFSFCIHSPVPYNSDIVSLFYCSK